MEGKQRERKTLSQDDTETLKTLLSSAITHHGAVCIHVAELWDGVLGIDGDDDLRAGLVPVKPTGHHFLSLQTDAGCIYCCSFYLFFCTDGLALF